MRGVRWKQEFEETQVDETVVGDTVEKFCSS